MKNQRSSFYLLLLVAFTFLVSIIMCSKSTNSEKNNNSESSNSINNSGGEGLMITVTGIPEECNEGNLYLALKSKKESDIVAIANGLISNGKADMYLYDFKDDEIAWKKAGKYYISISLPPVYNDSEFEEFNLKTTGNIFEYKSIDVGTSTISVGSSSAGQGIKINFVQIGSHDYITGEQYSISLYDSLEKYSNENEQVVWGQREPIAFGRAFPSYDGSSFEIYLYELKDVYEDKEKPWKKTGNYYLSVDLGERSYRYYYTGGKTLEELGIKKENHVVKSDYSKFPMYKLELTGNSIDFSQIKAKQMDR